MKMRALLTIVLFYFSIAVWSQSDSLKIAADSTRKNSFIIRLSSDAKLLGNALNIDFYQTFISGGMWSKHQNSRVMEALAFSNRSFLTASSELDFMEFPKSSKSQSKFNWKFNVGDHYYGHAQFAGDLYRLATNGNANYLNDTLHIGANHIQGLHYRSFGVGLSQHEGMDYITLSYVDGLRYYGLNSNAGYFYTSAQGDTIGVKSTFRQLRNQQNRKGVGIKIDLQKSFVGKKYKVHFQLRDLGWIKWNQLEKSVWKINETYTGIQWVDWIQINQPLDSTLNNWTDVRTSTTDKWIALPMSIGMQGAWLVVRDWEAGFSFRRWIYQENQGYRTISLKRIWDRYSVTRPNVSLAIQVNQSLTRQYWVGAAAGWTWNNGMSMELNTFSVASPVRKASKQIGLGISFQYVFGRNGTNNHQDQLEKNKIEPNEYFQF
jgi:hypothetical protein